MRRYRAILGLPGARGVFAATLAGRVGVAMYGLALVSMTVAGGGGYARAGLIAGTFAAAEAIGGPLSGHLLDRHGPRWVLPVLAAAHLAAVAALLIAVAALLVAPAVVPAAVAGATLAPFGALAGSRWSDRLNGDPRLRTAFALEALANDAAFMSGPLLAAALGGRLAVAGAAALTATAALLLSRRPGDSPTRPRRRRGRHPDADPARPRRRLGRRSGDDLSRLPRDRALEFRRSRPLRTPRRHAVHFTGAVAALGAVNVLLGLTFGTVQLTVTALGATALYLVMSAASLVATAVHGARRRPAPAVRGLAIAATLITTGLLVLTHAGPRPVMAGALVVIGAGVGPAIIQIGTLTQSHVPRPALTTTFALMAALSGAGIALAGLLVGR